MLRLNITDFERWGKLVKTWATGSNTYLQDGHSYPVPNTVQELKDQMANARAGTVPDNIKSVYIVPSEDDAKFVMYLPPAKAITGAETTLRKTGVYPLPAFYKEAFRGVDPRVKDFEKFNAQRIGEYTINYCQ